MNIYKDMKKEYIIPTVKVLKTQNEGIICLSNINEEGDGEQLSNETTFGSEFDMTNGNIWDN